MVSRAQRLVAAAYYVVRTALTFQAILSLPDTAFCPKGFFLSLTSLCGLREGARLQRMYGILHMSCRAVMREKVCRRVGIF
jgi:hypothetical protein